MLFLPSPLAVLPCVSPERHRVTSITMLTTLLGGTLVSHPLPMSSHTHTHHPSPCCVCASSPSLGQARRVDVSLTLLETGCTLHPPGVHRLRRSQPTSSLSGHYAKTGGGREGRALTTVPYSILHRLCPMSTLIYSHLLLSRYLSLDAILRIFNRDGRTLAIFSALCCWPKARRLSPLITDATLLISPRYFAPTYFRGEEREREELN